MWKASKPNEYLSFRTFIMGQTGNKNIYPKQDISFVLESGIIEKHSYRGETGAQDSLIPSVDNLFQIKYPKNKLTEYLFDLRKYRPKDHQLYIDYNQEMSKSIKLLDVIGKDIYTSLSLLKNINSIRMFRGKHWNLTKKYVTNNTKHPVATGGTPITTWLPNQLGATMENMYSVIENIESNSDKFNEKEYNEYSTLKLELDEHRDRLFDEVNALQKDFKQY